MTLGFMSDVPMLNKAGMQGWRKERARTAPHGRELPGQEIQGRLPREQGPGRVVPGTKGVMR